MKHKSINIDYIDIGKRIRTLRTQSGITQEFLAEQLDLTPAYLSRIERGKTKAGLSTLVAIANYFHISLDLLLASSLDSSTEVYHSEIDAIYRDCSIEELKFLARSTPRLLASIRETFADFNSTKNE